MDGHEARAPEEGAVSLRVWGAAYGGCVLSLPV
jgi:hypothetical protein